MVFMLRSSISAVRTSRFVSFTPGESQALWDEIGTAILIALENIHAGRELDFDNLEALAKASELPTDTLLPRLEIPHRERLELLRIAEEQDVKALAGINTALGPKQRDGGVGKRGADLSAQRVSEVGSLKDKGV
jgi:hypothetical protein